MSGRSLSRSLALGHAPQGSLYTVSDPWRQLVGPLRDGLQADTHGRSGSRWCSTQEADRFGLVHAAIKACFQTECKHAFREAGDTRKMSFQERLAEAMRDANTTPKALGAAVGVSVQAVSQTLSGSTRAFSAENCVKAARFLGVDSYWLATGDGDKRPALSPNTAMALSQEEKDVIVALRVLQADDRDHLVAAVLDKARAQVERLDALLSRNQKRDTTPNVVPLPRR